MSGLMQRILRRRGQARLSPEAPRGGHEAQPQPADGMGTPAATGSPEPVTARMPAAGATHGAVAASGEAATAVAPAVHAAPAQTAEPQDQPAGADAAVPAGVPDAASEEQAPSFRERARLRRRLRFLRRLRELGFRDLGGLVFEQHRFGRRDDELVRGKLTALAAVDAELRALERVLDDHRPVAELREPGISACAHCGAVIGSDARFCSSCGTPVRRS
jgi:hypothetical protein